MDEMFLKEINGVIKWIKDYVEKSGAKGVVVANSGGKDSAVVIALASKALGKERVVTVAIPCNSAQTDMDDAKSVAEKFEVPFLTVDILDTYNSLEREIERELQKQGLANEISKEGKINMKPRLRMTTVYSIAATLDYLVIGTGNLCEKTVGYTTKWGDSASDFNPIANFTVEEVLKIGEYLGVPKEIIEKAPNDGLGGQTDEEKLGVTYTQISEYILKGKTEEKAMEKIDKLYRASLHKRRKIPIYEVNNRVNYVEEKNRLY